MILAAMVGSDSAVVQRLWNSGIQCLRQSLTDTLPGQSGYVSREDSYGKSNANRVDPTLINNCSNDYISIGHVTQIENMKSVDCTTRTDEFDISSWLAGSGRRRSEVIGLEEIVTINLYDSTEQVSGALYDANASAVNVSSLNDCDPVIVEIKTTIFNGTDHNSIIALNNASSNQSWDVPLCVALEYGDSETWSDYGCQLIWWDETSAYCSCTHLSSFGTSLGDYFPNIDTFKDAMTADITWEAIWKNPITPICTILLIVLLFRLLPEIRYHASDYHLLAHKRIWSDQKWNLVKHSSFYNYLKAKSGKSLFSRCWKIYLWQVRNEHPVFGLYFRDTATNYTGHQRFLSLMASLAAALAIQAIFYGLTFETPYQETTTQGMVSVLCAIIPWLGKKIFKTHQTSEKNYGKLRTWNEDLVKVRTFCRCTCCCRKIERQASIIDIGFQAFSKQITGAQTRKDTDHTPLFKTISKHMRRKNSTQMYGFNVTFSGNLLDMEGSLESRHDPKSGALDLGAKLDLSESEISELTPTPPPTVKVIDTVTPYGTSVQTQAPKETPREVETTTVEIQKIGKSIIRRKMSKDGTKSPISLKPHKNKSSTPSYSEGKLEISRLTCNPPSINASESTDILALEILATPNEDIEGFSSGLKPMKNGHNTPIDMSRSCLIIDKLDTDTRFAAPTPYQTNPPKPQHLENEIPIITSDISNENKRPITDDQSITEDQTSDAPITRTAQHSKDPSLIEISPKRNSNLGNLQRKRLGELELHSIGKIEEDILETKGADDETVDDVGTESSYGKQDSAKSLKLTNPSTRGNDDKFENEIGSGSSHVKQNSANVLLTPTKPSGTSDKEDSLTKNDPLALGHEQTLTWDIITISNRMNILLDGEKGLSNKINISRKDVELLIDLQREYLGHSFFFPKCCKVFAFNLLIFWCLVCGVSIILFGINFDISAEAFASDEVVNSTKTQCDTRDFESVTLLVDVPLSSLMDLNLSETEADSWNFEYTPYPESDYTLLPDYLNESHRFLWGSLLSWLMGIFLISIAQELLLAIILSFIFCTERERLRKVLMNDMSKQDPRLLSTREGSFLLLLHPEVLILMERTINELDKDEICVSSYRDKCNDAVEGLINFCMNG